MKTRLYRSRDGAMLGGVAAGLAHYFDVDVTLVRLIWVLLFFAGGVGLGAYIIAWIIIPQEPVAGAHERIESGEDMSPEDAAEAADRRRRTGGVILVLVGAIILLGNVLSVVPHILRAWWPLALVAIGVYLLYDARRGRDK